MPANPGQDRQRRKAPVVRVDNTLPASRPLLRALHAEPEVQTSADGYDRRTIAFILLGLALAVTTVVVLVTSLLSGDPESPGSGRGAEAAASFPILPTVAPTAALPTAQPSLSPTGEVAGAESLTITFDMASTGSRVGGWTLRGSGELDIAAVPTAVDRSARLDAQDAATACVSLDVALGRLTAAFMVDLVPAGEQTLLSLDLDDGTTLDLTLIDGGLSVAETAEPVAIEAGTWYRWVVTRETNAARVRLLAADDALLAEVQSPSDGSGATEFCMTAKAPARVYLDELIGETR